MKPSTTSAASVPGITRRTFLGQCCSAVGYVGMLSTLAQLRAIGAAAPPPAQDYRALVCLFLAGGNDANNLLVPTDAAAYAAYAKARGALALPRDPLLKLPVGLPDGRAFGFHPATADLHQLYTAGHAAVLANVGTLVVPTTRDQFQKQSVPLPYQLFAHNEQQVQWQSSLAEQGAADGWGGRLADLSQAFNENATLSMSISVAGQNSFQFGRQVAEFCINPRGVTELVDPAKGPLHEIRTAARTDLLTGSSENLFESAFAGAMTDAIHDSGILAQALANSPPLATPFPDTPLGRQLRMIAQLIAIAPQFGLRRQIFFAQLGGWDLHDRQLAPHARLLDDLGRSLAAFHRATVELKRDADVTTFTASDFGRTYTTNGDGSDHGWGSHHLIIGGAVKGGRIYGTMPELAVNGPDDTGRGRWIPTTSVDEYSATLARWFGVSDADLPVVLPNIGNFARRDLGFLKTTRQAS